MTLVSVYRFSHRKHFASLGKIKNSTLSPSGIFVISFLISLEPSSQHRGNEEVILNIWMRLVYLLENRVFGL